MGGVEQLVPLMRRAVRSGKRGGGTDVPWRSGGVPPRSAALAVRRFDADPPRSTARSIHDPHSAASSLLARVLGRRLYTK